MKLQSMCDRALLVLVVFALGAAPGSPARAASEPIILAFGDSLTAGYGVRPEQAYPALLQERLRAAGYAYRVVDAGVSGDTTAGGLRRVDWALKLRPEIAIIELGANDGLRGKPAGDIQANLEQIARRFQAGGVRVILAGMKLPPNYGAYAAEFEQIFPRVARSTGAVLMPFFLDGVAGNPALTLIDGVHPTAAAYPVVVKGLWPYLAPLLRR